MIALQVTARLAGGIVATSWGVALDGLLAAVVSDRLKHAGDLVDVDTELELPLARCELAGGEQWHWAATTAYILDEPGRVDVRSWTGRVDHRDLEMVAGSLPKVISGRQGRWRDRRMPLVVIPCRELTWTAVGDPGAVAELLAEVGSIGKKRASGEGHVLGWDVVERPDLDAHTAGHLHPNGRLGRPAPTGCLSAPAEISSGRGTAGLRPPHHHPDRQRELWLPDVLGA